MSYRIKIGDVDAFNNDIPGMQLGDPTLTLELSKAGTLTFKLPALHNSSSLFSAPATILRVYDDSTLVFKGRMLTESSDFLKTRSVTCEGPLAFLNDSIIRPFDFSGSLKDFFTYVITAHNKDTKPWQHITPGTISITDDYVHYSSTDYLSAWDVIKTRVLETHGGYIRIRYDVKENAVLDYAEGFTGTTHTVAAGENLIDLNQSRSAENTYTACIPLGAKIEQTLSDGTTQERRLTIETENDGYDYLIDTGLAASYGVIYAPVTETTWDNVTVAKNLYDRGKQYLENKAATLRDTITIDAALLGNRPALGDTVQLISSAHNLTATMLINKITYQLCSPYAVRISLGAESRSMLEQSLTMRQHIAQLTDEYLNKSGAARNIALSLKNDTAPQLKAEIEKIVQSVISGSGSRT